ncbi:uncharacterized protein LOC115622438 [Scaptodrosophila lebanonensis]|uniref:Uncharacterized protein LOC115622438 n=1 Tax=Drosophila lebanonensis TaxID=7225 RepID=A0A6J2TA73_DROLE|nr:uncharacterized protein LOC115622438 [Scaptodrosophila lebanonensis]
MSLRWQRNMVAFGGPSLRTTALIIYVSHHPQMKVVSQRQTNWHSQSIPMAAAYPTLPCPHKAQGGNQLGHNGSIKNYPSSGRNVVLLKWTAAFTKPLSRCTKCLFGVQTSMLAAWMHQHFSECATGCGSCSYCWSACCALSMGCRGEAEHNGPLLQSSLAGTTITSI